MGLTISKAFELPDRAAIQAMGFVVRLRDDKSDGKEMRRLVSDYVVTPTVNDELPSVLKTMRQVHTRGEEAGWFVHGSFGSGKSHFMSVLGLLLEGTGHAWSKPGPDGGPCFAHIEENRSWLEEARLLVVRIHMLSARGREKGLARVVYEAFNEALARRGKDPFEFLSVDAVLDEARKEAGIYGDAFWANMRAAEILGGPEDFDELAKGPAEDRELLARSYLDLKGRDAADAGFDPPWADGLHGMAEHARKQGFGGIVLMVDELLLWLGEKSGRDFVREVNDLNVVVDHNTGQRAVPVFIFVAQQRNLREFFPDYAQDDRIYDQIQHHAKRFDFVRLEDVELRHIVKGRVLRPKEKAEVAKAVDGLAESHGQLIPALLHDADVGYLKDVYPFHPALIEMLVDVTSLMQRERSALRLLYELLVIHQPDLPLGEFVSVGRAFDAVFPPAGVDASKKQSHLSEIHKAWYRRLKVAVDQAVAAADGSGLPWDQARQTALELMIKTVLLGEISQRLRGTGLTVERLVQLNSAEVEGESYRGRVLQAGTDLQAISQAVPDLQIAGTGKTAVVRFLLGRVSLDELLKRARTKVDNQPSRFATLYSALKPMLGVEAKVGFRKDEKNEGAFEVLWRNTRRKGGLKIGNVREMGYGDFVPGEREAFRLLVDYPWDEPGMSVEHDRQQAQKVRKARGNQPTVCWLPAHFSSSEHDLVVQLAAVRYLKSAEGEADLMADLSPKDKTEALDQASTREMRLTGQLEELLRRVYVDQGELVALTGDIPGDRPFTELHQNLEHVARLLLDRLFPGHPSFGAQPTRNSLEGLLQWMIDAGDGHVSVAYDPDTGKALEHLGKALELCNLGHAKASLRLDSRYIKDVLTRADAASLSWQPVADHLQSTYGLQQEVCDLFLCFLCARGYRALHALTGDPVEVRIGRKASTPIRLERGKLLDAAAWSRARELGQALFGCKLPPAHRSLQTQDGYCTELKELGVEHRQALQGLHTLLAGFEVEEGARAQDVKEANARLAPLAREGSDSFDLLTELLAKWPDDGDDPLRKLVMEAATLRDAVSEIDETARTNLRAGVKHAEHGQSVREHLDKLDRLLSSRDHERPLTKSGAAEWNRQAQEWVHKLIEIIYEPTPTPTPDPTEKMPTSVLVRDREKLDLGDPDAVGLFVGALRTDLTALGADLVRVDVIVHPEPEK